MIRLILISFICLTYVLVSEAVKWKDCGGNRSLVHFKSLKLSPEKVHFGARLTASSNVVVDRHIKGETMSNLKIWRILRLFGYEMVVKIGCYYGYGSCVRKLSDVVHDNKVMCDWYKAAMNGTCETFTGNIDAGNFTATDMRTKFPEVHGITAALLGGNYRVKWEWFLKDQAPFACFVADFLVE